MTIKDFTLNDKDSKLFTFDYAEKTDDGYLLEVSWDEEDTRVYDLLGFPLEDFDLTYLDLYLSNKNNDTMKLMAYGVNDMGEIDSVTRVCYKLHNTSGMVKKAKRFLSRIDYVD